MSKDAQYEMLEGIAPKTPELNEAVGTEPSGTSYETSEIERKLDLILQALGIEEEQR